MPADRRLADAATKGLAGLLVRVFFRSFEVAGAEHVPAGGPLIEVANHRNGLVDGLVLVAASPRYPRFLAKSTLWRIVPLRPFLYLAGAVPVYRRADAGKGPDRGEGNRAALARAARLLAGGETIGVFPEGVSHDLASLQELRTGTARLALEAVAEGTAGVRIVPAGIFYDDKSRFRSRVSVRFGQARTVDAATSAGEGRVAVRRLTAGVASDLRSVGPEFESVDLATRCSRLAALAGSGLDDEQRLARRLADAAADPATAAEWAALDARLAAYDAGLSGLGVADAQLVAVARDGARGAPLTGSLAWAVSLPVAAVGVAIHAGPYLLIRLLGRLPSNQGMRSTVKLLGSFGLYSLVYLGIGVAAGRRRGPLAGALAAGGAPLCGWVALRTLEEAQGRGGLRRAAAAVGRRRHRAAELLAERDGLRREVRALAGGGAPTPITRRTRG